MENSATFLRYVRDFDRMIAELDDCDMDDDEFIGLSFERNHWQSCYEQSLQEEAEIGLLRLIANEVIWGT